MTNNLNFNIYKKYMNNNLSNLSNSELIKIIKDLQDENNKIKMDLRTMEILKSNYEKEKEIEINYRKEIFSIVKDDIYMKNIVGPKPTYSSKNDIKFCIKELYNVCKELDIFMKNNNLKNRSEFIKIIKNNRLTLDKDNKIYSLYEKYNIKDYNELENIIKKYKNANITNSDRDINDVIKSVENIILEEEKQHKIQCVYKPVKGKNKDIRCNKYVNNETRYSDNPLCSGHKRNNVKKTKILINS